jgi:putative hydrolase of the HAD superfamily
VSTPDGAVFATALRRAGVPAARAVHVGDSLDEDVKGARAAGIEPLLLARGASEVPAGVRSLRSLSELAPVLDEFAQAGIPG